MRPGERLTLIQNIYATLVAEEWGSWDMVDTALSEFGAEWVATEDPVKRTLERLRSLSDDNLIALNAHLHPDDADLTTSASDVGAGPWEANHFRLFLSHTSAHKKVAGDLRNAMLPVGIDSFVAHTTIEPTKEWVEEIERALRTCDALVALITPDFIESRWCDQELGVCYGIGTLVVPVRVGLDPYGFIGKFQAASFDATREHVATLRDRLFDLLASHPQTQARMVDPVLQRFTGSWSWDNTRAAWPSVKALPQEAWTDERVTRVREAARDNVDVREASINEGGWQRAPILIERHLQSLGIAPEQPASSSFPDDDIPF
jgi:TIR domain-containing protein